MKVICDKKTLLLDCIIDNTPTSALFDVPARAYSLIKYINSLKTLKRDNTHINHPDKCTITESQNKV